MVNIYKITNSINGKVYIGQTVNKLNIRFNQHINYASRAKETGKALYYLSKAILKYGRDAFTISLIETINEDIANEREIYWIEYFNSYESGYNLNKGGHFRQRPESKKYIPTESHKLNMSKAKKGKKPHWSDESLEALRQAKLGSNNPNFGKKAIRKVCEYCYKDVANNVYIQYHGTKCKGLKSRV